MRKKAFTIIELVVVISVISLVMAILMPVLSQARQQVKTTMCLSNLRQMMLTALMYAGDNDDYFPWSVISYINGSLYNSRAWDFTTVYNSGRRYVEPGLLWQGEMLKKIQQCPSFKGAANWADDPYTGYNYNTSYIGGMAAIKNRCVVKGTVVMSSRNNNIRKPDSCAIFGDGEWAEGANKFMRSPFAGKLDKSFVGRYAGTQGYRHNGKTNVAWCDGHASSQKELYTETLAGEKTKLDQYNNNAKTKIGFLSPDNSAYDLQ